MKCNPLTERAGTQCLFLILAMGRTFYGKSEKGHCVPAVLQRFYGSNTRRSA